MIKAQPIKEKDIYHRTIYQEIKFFLDKILFEPILEIAESKDIDNAVSKELLTALRKGTITYAKEYFTGTFKASIGLELRKIGATWDKGKKAYYLPQGRIPTDVKIAIAQGISDIQSKIAKINKKLDYLQTSGAIATLGLSKQIDLVLGDIDKQIKTTIPKDIGLPMTLSEFQKEAIRREYTDNLNKYIKKLTIDSTTRLREKVQEQVSQGYRASSLLDVIHAQKGVSDRHALFIAKQEISLLTSTYRDARYKEAGINKYIWASTHDNRVRHDHKILDGKVFNFNRPPVTNQATGARNNPGYDFGCRCRAVPILPDDKELFYGEDNVRIRV